MSNPKEEKFNFLSGIQISCMERAQSITDRKQLKKDGKDGVAAVIAPFQAQALHLVNQEREAKGKNELSPLASSIGTFFGTLFMGIGGARVAHRAIKEKIRETPKAEVRQSQESGPQAQPSPA